MHDKDLRAGGAGKSGSSTRSGPKSGRNNGHAVAVLDRLGEFSEVQASHARSLLGCALLDWNSVRDTVLSVDPRNIPDGPLRTVFEAILAVYGRDGVPDQASVSTYLLEAGMLDDVGGISFVAGLVDHTPTSTNVGYFAAELKRLAQPRILDELLRYARSKAAEPNADVPGIATALMESLGDTFAPRGLDGIPATTDNRRPEPMGRDAYHGLAGEWVDLILPHTEADPNGLILNLLCQAGNAMGAHSYSEVEETRHYPGLYIALVGDTAAGRKGTAQGRARSLLARVDQGWATSNQGTGLSSGEGVISRVRDPRVVPAEKPDKRRRKNESPEGFSRTLSDEPETVLMDEGVRDKRLLVTEEELASVLAMTTRKGNTLSPVLRSAWDNGNLSIMTRNEPLTATKAHISLIGHITSQELTRNLNCTETANGFANRFLWCFVQRSKMLPDGGSLDPGALNDVVVRLKQAVDFARYERRVDRDDDARDLWHQVYPGLTEGRPGLLGALVARGAPQVVRMSLIYALLDRSSVIRVEHLRAALEVWRYCFDSIQFIFGGRTGDPVADEILMELKRRPDGLTRTQISEHFNRNIPSKDLMRALQNLKQWGKIRLETVPAPNGRPAERVYAT